MSSIPYKTDLKNNQNLFPNSYQKQTKGEVFLPGETAKPFQQQMKNTSHNNT